MRVATESQVRAAELARLEGLVDEHATESEKFALLVSGVMRHGISVEEFEGLEPSRRRSPDPALLGTIARRVERRARFNLPAENCSGDPAYSGCRCLEEALDSGARSRRAVLKAAASRHWAPPVRSVRPGPSEEPREPPAVPEMATGSVSGPVPGDALTSSSEPSRERVPEPEKVRVVRRSRRWYDADPDIRKTKF